MGCWKARQLTVTVVDSKIQLTYFVTPSPNDTPIEVIKIEADQIIFDSRELQNTELALDISSNTQDDSGDSNES